MLERALGLLQGGILQPLPWLSTGIGARISAAVDILLVATLLTVLFRFIRRTRATNILVGFLFVGVGIVIARVLNLATLNLVFTVFFALLVFALPILFQPELRRGLERLGRRGPFRNGSASTLEEPVLREIIMATESLAENQHGALIILERHTGLSEYSETGTPLGAAVSAELLETIFMPGSPLHDGAVIIREGLVVAAGCTLPLAEESKKTRLGTRHRAALGMSDVSDALAIVVSEERGVISVAQDGELLLLESAHELTTLLRNKPS